MTQVIELPQNVEEIAAAQAQQNGKTLEEYLPELIVSALARQPAVQSPEHRAERIRRFRQWAQSNGHATPHLSDEEVSRDALYAES